MTIARNVSTRYVAIATEALLGIIVLPLNLAFLGPSAYGLWMLTASITAYFSILDLGYSGAVVKFVAQYRARRDSLALNEILSTAFIVFATCGAVIYLIALGVSFFLGDIFQLTPDQVHTGRVVLLIVTAHVSTATAFSVFGGVINGFQRYDLNNLVGALNAVVVSIVNVAVLALGYGLIELVAATTIVRIATLLIYRANAYRVFPELRIRPSLFRRARLGELTGFSIYMAVIEWALKLNYSVDALVIGAFLGTSAVAIWTVGQRIAEITQRLSNQLNEILFPAVVDSDAAERLDQLQMIFVQGTRLSLATVVPLGAGIILLAGPLVRAWVGPSFAASVPVLQILTVVVIVRVGTATASTLLKGAGRHRFLAVATGATALANLALSVALVKPLGLLGVALGTLIPIGFTSLMIIFPAGCRRVGLSLPRALGRAVWPAAWPAAIMALYLFGMRSLVPDSLILLGVELGSAGLLYGVLFLFFGVDATERRVYLDKFGELTGIQRLRLASETA